MIKARKMKVLNATYNDVISAGNSGKLREVGIATLAEYNMIYDILGHIVNCGKYSETISGNVAEFFNRHGFNAVPYGIGWKISL